MKTNKIHLLIPVILSVITILIYYQTLNFNFKFDDIASINKGTLSQIKTFQDMFLSGTRWISYWINGLIFKNYGLDPFFYKLFALFLHVISGNLIFLIFYFALNRQNLIIPAISAAFFLLHPVQTQTVCYTIQGELEGLACTFCLLTIFFSYLKFRFSENIFLYILFSITTSTILVLGCGTKEIFFITPLLCIMFDWFFLSRGDFQDFKKRIFFNFALLFSVVFIYAVLCDISFIVNAILLKLDAVNSVGHKITNKSKILPFDYLISQFKVIVHYFKIAILPINLSIDYEFQMEHSILSKQVLIPLFLILLSLGYAIKRFIKNKSDILSFSIIWFFITILPRSSIIPSSEPISDYKSYLACIGIFLMLAYLTNSFYLKLLNKKYEKPFYISFSILLICLTLGTYSRNKTWSDDSELWRQAKENAPNSPRVLNNYAVCLITKSQFEQAIELLKKAVSLDPNYVDAWSNLASCFEHENNLPEAIKSIQEAIKNAINLPKYHYILGKLLLKAQVNPKLAKFSFKNALAVNPTHTPSLFCLGSMYLNEKKIEKAERLLAACVKLGDFEEKETLTRYALCCAQLGKNEQAIKSFEKIIENYKDDPLSKKQLELAYKSLKKLKNF